MADRWLETLRAGDPVLINGRHPTKVIRLTPTLIITERNQRFRKSNGRQTGSPYGNTLLEPTPARLDELRHSRLINKMRNLRWSEISLGVLVKVDTALVNATEDSI